MLSKQKKIMDNVLFFICVQLNSMISILFFFVKYYCSEQLLFFLFPGEYVQNLCNPRDSTCAKCPSRLPSCVGQSDGFQPFPNLLWEEKYIQCYKNRTMKVAQCPMKQYFNPRTLKCADKVVPGRISF